MRTPLGAAVTADYPERDRTPVPLGRMGTAWEAAYAVTCLLWAEASYIAGTVLDSCRRIANAA